MLFRGSAMHALLTRTPLKDMRAHTMALDFRTAGCEESSGFFGWVGPSPCLGSPFRLSLPLAPLSPLVTLKAPPELYERSLMHPRLTMCQHSLAPPVRLRAHPCPCALFIVRLFTLQHLSYFMSSEMIVSKLRGWGGFLWASQPNQPAFKIVSQSHSAEGLASADRNLSRWAANCRPLYGGQASAMPPPPCPAPPLSPTGPNRPTEGSLERYI